MIHNIFAVFYQKLFQRKTTLVTVLIVLVMLLLVGAILGPLFWDN